MRKVMALVVAVCGLASAQGGGILQPNSTMFPGQVTFSPDGRTHLNFQRDGNVVLYYGAQPLWATQTDGCHATELRMQPDGNWVLYGDRETLWTSNTSGNPGAQLRV